MGTARLHQADNKECLPLGSFRGVYFGYASAACSRVCFGVCFARGPQFLSSKVSAPSKIETARHRYSQVKSRQVLHAKQRFFGRSGKRTQRYNYRQTTRDYTRCMAVVKLRLSMTSCHHQTYSEHSPFKICIWLSYSPL